MIKKILEATLLLFLVFCSCSFAREVTVYTDELSPLHYEKDGGVTGIATDIVRAIFVQAGLQPVFEVYPWKRSYAMVQQQPDSFIFTINRTQKREPLFHWIGPILPKRTCLYKRASRTDIDIQTLEDAKKYTTAVILGYALTEMMKSRGFEEGRDLLVTRDKQTQVNAFFRGHADLITGNEYTIGAVLRKAGLTSAAIEPVLLVNDTAYYIAANIETAPGLIARLREANKVVQQQNIVDQVLQKYSGELASSLAAH